MPQNAPDFSRCPFCRAELQRIDEKTRKCPDPEKRGCGFHWRKNAAGQLYTVREPAAETHARSFFEIYARDSV